MEQPKDENIKEEKLSKKRSEINICKTRLDPQPNILEAIGVLASDHLTVKKILPRIENLARERLGALYG